MKVTKKMLLENYNNEKVAKKIYEKHKTQSFKMLPEGKDKDDFGIYISLLYAFKDYGFSDPVKYATIYKELLKTNASNEKFIIRPTSLYAHDKDLVPFKTLMKIAICLNAINIDFYTDVYFYALINVYKRPEHGNSTAVYVKEVYDEYCNLLNVLDIDVYKFSSEEYEDMSNIVITDDKISLKKFYDMERQIEQIVKEHPIHQINKKDLPLKTSDGFTLTDEQSEACNYISQNDGIFIIQGDAGTGKTMIANHFLEHNNYNNILISAPSAQAAKIISESTGYDAVTMDSIIYNNNNSNNDKEYDIIILDEMSMVDNYKFLMYINSIASFKKLVLLGDINQLSSVARGQLFKDLQRTVHVKSFYLTKVLRYDNGILNYAQAILRNKYMPLLSNEVSSSYAVLDEYKLLHYLNNNKYFNDVRKNKILTPVKGGGLGVYRINIAIQKELQKKRMLKNVFLKNEYYTFYLNDKIMFNKNTRINNKLYQNGSEYIINNIDQDNITLESLFDNSLSILDFESIKDRLQLSYATTIHKSQGSSYDNLFICGQGNTSAFLFTRQMLYTAVTRAKVHCHMLLDKEIYRRIIYKKETTVTTLFQIKKCNY